MTPLLPFKLRRVSFIFKCPCFFSIQGERGFPGPDGIPGLAGLPGARVSQQSLRSLNYHTVVVML